MQQSWRPVSWPPSWRCCWQSAGRSGGPSWGAGGGSSAPAEKETGGSSVPVERVVALFGGVKSTTSARAITPVEVRIVFANLFGLIPVWGLEHIVGRCELAVLLGDAGPGADRSSRLALLHVADAALSCTLTVKAMLASVAPAHFVQSSQAILRQAHTCGGSAHFLEICSLLSCR